MRNCLQQQAAIVALLAALVSSQQVMLAGQGQPMGLPNCTTICGNVSVPYPFGIEPGCQLEGFNVFCNTRQTPPRLYFKDNDTILIQILELSLDTSTLHFMAPSQQPNNTSDSPGCHLFSKLGQLDWEVGSSALQGVLPGDYRPGSATCPRDLGSTACHSSHSTCRATTGRYKRDSSKTTGYTCTCDMGYQGNPYLSDGCQDIDECSRPDECFGNCMNLPGKYLCQCPWGTYGNPYIPNGCTTPKHPGHIIGLGVGSGAILVSLVLGTKDIARKIKIIRTKKTRHRFFKQNRGQLLQQLVCQRADIAERMIVTLKELEKATNNFDKARELGGGGHGTVYKGILSSLHVVAIKRSKIVIQREIDDFINEVAILSQINHRNIVKLFGCCLETEVPLLVYEFISNGTLYNHLHVETLVSLSWIDRLRIAVETARALAYLHSLVSMPIIHRDVKSPNILLDDNLTVKLSDFGASRYVPIDQTGVDTTVQGTFGYLDPMYYSTGHLTEKSDVYSFGVILIELLTRKKPVSYRSPQGYSLVNHFVTLLSEGNNLVHMLDPQVRKEGGGEVVDVALLAAICVKFISKDRPTMRQVEMTLESIYAAKESASSDMTDESEDNYVQVNDISVGGTNVDSARSQGLIARGWREDN
ncbi:unnamed protein product [Urochloa decumbens]|uniref:Protein kinase domain-containing protein n=1 Tax=Urochloa decumbens TaxID=240449 RepID=A0ABC9B7J4_9POAL